MRKIRNILQHELIGLDCTVVKSDNSYQVGINGRIINETMKTISIEAERGVKKILKKGSVLKIHLKGKDVVIDGSFINLRSEDRIKKKLRKW